MKPATQPAPRAGIAGRLGLSVLSSFRKSASQSPSASAAQHGRHDLSGGANHSRATGLGGGRHELIYDPPAAAPEAVPAVTPARRRPAPSGSRVSPSAAAAVGSSAITAASIHNNNSSDNYSPAMGGTDDDDLGSFGIAKTPAPTRSSGSGLPSVTGRTSFRQPGAGASPRASNATAGTNNTNSGVSPRPAASAAALARRRLLGGGGGGGSPSASAASAQGIGRDSRHSTSSAASGPAFPLPSPQAYVPRLEQPPSVGAGNAVGSKQQPLKPGQSFSFSERQRQQQEQMQQEGIVAPTAKPVPLFANGRIAPVFRFSSGSASRGRSDSDTDDADAAVPSATSGGDVTSAPEAAGQQPPPKTPAPLPKTSSRGRMGGQHQRPLQLDLGHVASVVPSAAAALTTPPGASASSSTSAAALFPGEGVIAGEAAAEEVKEEAIQVCVRFRPLLHREAALTSGRIGSPTRSADGSVTTIPLPHGRKWQLGPSTVVEDSEVTKKAYSYDAVLGLSATNAQVRASV